MGEYSVRRSLWLELALVVVISLAVLVPGITNYSLVDPWESHYGEVARNMVKDHDYVHMQWPGTNLESSPNEGFRSKPVLTFWLMSAGMHAVGLDHGYSGEMVHDTRTMIAIRLPIILCAVLGLVLVWWMLARLVSRRLAWLALIVVGSCPFFCLVARQGIPDMPLLACVMGAIAMFTMAVEDGETAVGTLFTIRLPRGRRFAVDQRHVLFAICGSFLALQAIYYAIYFISSPQLAVRHFPMPAVVLPALVAWLVCALSSGGWIVFRFLSVIAGSLVAFGFSRRSRLTLRAFDEWDAYSLDRFAIRVLALPIAWARHTGWRSTNDVADRVLHMAPITSKRQVYLLGCYAFLGFSVLAKGPPGLAVVGFVGVFHVILLGRWRALYEGAFELKRGLVMMIAIFLPWHLAMFLKEGPAFLNEYLFTHLIDRAAVGSADKSFGTFEYYTSQLGHGMWLWAALIPAALAAAFLRSRTDTREGRVRFMMTLWAICGFGFFALVQTKFHHYILPVVPALGILVAFYLDDLWQGRDRLHPLYAALGIGIVLLVTRDLMWEPKRWIEMFVFLYSRPWPGTDPWQIDPSDGFLALGALAAIAVVLVALPWRRVGVVALCASGIAICLWSLHAYMPVAGTHWGMREAMATYYQQRTIHGEKLVYFSARELYDDWHDAGDTWTFDTVVPETLQVGQPMTLTIVLKRATDERITEQELALLGTVTSVGDHSIKLALARGERARLDPLVKTGATAAHRRPPLRVVDAERLIAYRLYWRGEQFWSNGEIWAELPEQKTSFPQDNNVEFIKYVADRTRTPIGHRYFVITDPGHVAGLRSLLPTPRARDSFEILDTTSNKFLLAAFYM